MSDDIDLWLRRARIANPDSPEIEPGVTKAEADAACAHAIVIQGGYSTPEIEAKRLSADRAKAARLNAMGKALKHDTPTNIKMARGPRPTLMIFDEAADFEVSEADREEDAWYAARTGEPEMPTDEQFREDDEAAMNEEPSHGYWEAGDHG